MTKAAAFKATYSDWKLIKTRSVVQIVFEVPLNEADAAYHVVGGMPDIGGERWFGIARLNGNKPVEAAGSVPVVSAPDQPHQPRKPVAAEKRLANEAGRMCADPVFQAFVIEISNPARVANYLEPMERTEESASVFVRKWCGVDTRASIIPGTRAGEAWLDLRGRFEAWKLVDAA